jgi:hypothetical protein
MSSVNNTINYTRILQSSKNKRTNRWSSYINKWILNGSINDDFIVNKIINNQNFIQILIILLHHL